MVNVIPSTHLEEPVLRFLAGLNITNDVTLVELGSRKVYLMACAGEEVPEREPTWDLEQDRRRNELIDRQIKETITLAEAVELTELQSVFSRWLDVNAPLPFDEVRDLHRQLVEQVLGVSHPE